MIIMMIYLNQLNQTHQKKKVSICFFRKAFIIIFLVFFSFPLFAHQWLVYDIKVNGLKNIKEKLILKTIRAKKNKLYYDEDKKSDIENLINLGSIDRVVVEVEPISDISSSSPTIQPVRVVYTITEKPYINRIVIDGNKKLSNSSIKNTLSIDEGDFYDELKFREGIEKLYQNYQEKGYIFASAEWSINVDSTTNKASLNIKIREGNQVRVKDVDVKGVDSEKEKKKVVKLMKNRPKKIFLKNEIEKDIKEIEDYYKNNGYIQFKILSSTYVISDMKDAFIKIELYKGKKYKFGKYEFAGVYLFSSKDDFKKIIDAVEFREGEKFKDEKLADTIKNIQELYADRGYLRVSISTSIVFRDDYADVHFTVEENYPFYVRNIYIEGNKSTKTKVFKREMVQKDEEYCSSKGLDRSCRLFSLSKIRRSQEKIYNLGFIENIDMTINPTELADEVDLAFDITEGKPGMLTAGAGISSKDGLMGMISLSHMNMFGLANRLSVNWNFGKRVQDYSMNWTIPWIYDKPTSLGFSLFNNRRYRSYSTTYSAYTEKRTGGSVFISPRFEDDKYALKFGYSYERIKVYDVDDIYLSEIHQGTSVQSSLSMEFSRDSRDYIWDPTSGTRFSVGVELFGGILGGDVNIYKPTISYSYNKKLFSIGGWPFVFSVANRFGWVKEFSDSKDVPVYERFFLGGADTVRGYNSNGQVGPLDGGKVYYVSNFEFKFPLAREKKRTIVQWAFFLDIGNAWKSFDDISFKIGSSTRYLKTGAGFGIRFTTPAFPIRLDWGYGFNHKPGESKSDIYFTLGNLF